MDGRIEQYRNSTLTRVGYTKPNRYSYATATTATGKRSRRNALNSVGRLADDFDIADHGVLALPVLLKGGHAV